MVIRENRSVPVLAKAPGRFNGSTQAVATVHSLTHVFIAHYTGCFSQLTASLRDHQKFQSWSSSMQPSRMAAFIHSNPSRFLIRKYCPFLQLRADLGLHTENTSPITFSVTCSHPHSLIYRCPVTDISRSSSTLAPSAIGCLSPRWHSTIFIGGDEHVSLHLHLLARCLTLIFFFTPSRNSCISPTWL